MRSLYLLVASLLLSSVGAMGLDLTGIWEGNAATPSEFYFRQLDDQVWFLGEGIGYDPDPYNWTVVGYGSISDDELPMNYADVPKGNGTLSGTIVLKLLSDQEMQLINQTGGFGGEDWDKVRLTKIS